jgi:hypothetical protein
MACTPAPSHFIWEMGHRGHVEQIWRRRSCGTWCVQIQTVNDSRWARGELDPLKSHEKACTEWTARVVESRVGT